MQKLIYLSLVVLLLHLCSLSSYKDIDKDNGISGIDNTTDAVSISFSGLPNIPDIPNPFDISTDIG